MKKTKKILAGLMERKRIHATKKLEHTGYTRSSG